MTTDPKLYPEPQLLNLDPFAGPDLRNTNGRGYTHPISRDVVPGVTTISGLMDKPHLVKWSAKLAAQWAATNLTSIEALPLEGRAGAIIGAAEVLRSQARDTGSLAHEVIEALARGEDITIPDLVAHQVAGWQEFTDTIVWEFLHTEVTVWSYRHGYAGTLDTIARLRDGRIALIDYKTGSNVYPEAAMQLWALRNADVIIDTNGEQPMPQVDDAYVLHLPALAYTPTGRVSSTSKWSLRSVCTCEEEERGFLALLAAHRWEHTHSREVIGGKMTKLPTPPLPITAQDLTDLIHAAPTYPDLLALHAQHRDVWGDVHTLQAGQRRKEVEAA